LTILTFDLHKFIEEKNSLSQFESQTQTRSEGTLSKSQMKNCYFSPKDFYNLKMWKQKFLKVQKMTL